MKPDRDEKPLGSAGRRCGRRAARDTPHARREQAAGAAPQQRAAKGTVPLSLELASQSDSQTSDLRHDTWPLITISLQCHGRPASTRRPQAAHARSLIAEFWLRRGSRDAKLRTPRGRRPAQRGSRLLHACRDGKSTVVVGCLWVESDSQPLAERTSRFARRGNLATTRKARGKFIGNGCRRWCRPLCFNRCQHDSAGCSAGADVDGDTVACADSASIT